MDKARIEGFVGDFVESGYNRITADVARVPEVVGWRLYDEPAFAYGDARDRRFVELADNPEAHVPLMPPVEWLPSASTVISCFMPISKEIRRSNRTGDDPSWGWLHSRIEGANALNILCEQLIDFIDRDGYTSLRPSRDKRLVTTRSAPPNPPMVTTNWSERHVGYLCGLGTFSLSKALITEKGCAGRIFSLITSLELEPTVAAYQGIFDYCSNCGKCARRCPVGAISEYNMKDDWACKRKCNEPLEHSAPYYGCGKCMIGTPCEHAIPRKRRE